MHAHHVCTWVKWGESLKICPSVMELTGFETDPDVVQRGLFLLIRGWIPPW